MRKGELAEERPNPTNTPGQLFVAEFERLYVDPTKKNDFVEEIEENDDAHESQNKTKEEPQELGPNFLIRERNE